MFEVRLVEIDARGEQENIREFREVSYKKAERIRKKGEEVRIVRK